MIYTITTIEHKDERNSRRMRLVGYFETLDQAKYIITIEGERRRNLLEDDFIDQALELFNDDKEIKIDDAHRGFTAEELLNMLYNVALANNDKKLTDLLFAYKFAGSEDGGDNV